MTKPVNHRTDILTRLRTELAEGRVIVDAHTPALAGLNGTDPFMLRQPFSSPADAQFMLDRCPDLDGFSGASSMERLPTEKALTAEVARFASLTLGMRRAGQGRDAVQALSRASGGSRG